MEEKRKWLEEAVQLAKKNVASGHGGPFAALVVQNGRIVGKGVNEVERTHDPTAHAEIQAIRQACSALGTYLLEDCEIYASGEPCPMCMAAIYWARLKAVYYACSKQEAVKAGYQDRFTKFHEDMQKPSDERSIPVRSIQVEGYLDPFHLWREKANNA